MNKKIVFLYLLIAVLINLTFTIEHAYAVDFEDIICNVRNLAVNISTSIVVIGWIIAGFLYLTSGGNPTKTEIAKKAVIAAVIGTFLIVISAVSVEVFNIIMQAIGVTGTPAAICS